MKSLVSLIAAVGISTSFAAELKPPEVVSTWMKLSVRVQNVAWQFQQLDPTGAPNPSFFSEDLQEIDRLLSVLVSKGGLVKFTVKLRPPKGRDKDHLQIMGFTEKLAETYGMYVSLELMDLGLRRRLSAMEEDEPFVMKVHLPADQLETFLALVKEHEMSAK